MANGLRRGKQGASLSNNATQAKANRWIIYTQLWAGLFLIVFAALLVVIYKAFGLDITQTPAAGLATGILGIGAALFPATAAGAASVRILQQLPSITPTLPSITEVKVSDDKKSVSASITAPDGGVGAYVETALPRTPADNPGFSEPSPLNMLHVPSAPGLQTVVLPAKSDGSPLGSGERVRVVVAVDSELTLKSDEVVV